MKRTWMPPTAGLLLATASVPYFVVGARFYIHPENLPQSLGGTGVWAPVGFIIWLPFIAPLMLGMASAFARRVWGLVVACAVLPIVFSLLLSPWMETSLASALFFSTPLPYSACRAVEFLASIFMVAAAVLVVLSRKTAFSGRKSAAEYLYGPPKGWKGPDD